MPAELIVVVERIDVRGRHVGVGREIAVGVEQRVRIAPLLPADGLEVLERIDAARPRRPGLLLQVVDVVEAVRRRSARSARTAGGLRCAPNARKCASGSTCAAATSGLAARYCARIEVERRHAALLPADRCRSASSGLTPGRLHVRIGREIDRGGEERVRVAALVPAERVVVRVGVDMRVPHVVIAANSRTGRRPAGCRRCCPPCRR